MTKNSAEVFNLQRKSSSDTRQSASLNHDNQACKNIIVSTEDLKLHPVLEEATDISSDSLPSIISKEKAVTVFSPKTDGMTLNNPKADLKKKKKRVERFLSPVHFCEFSRRKIGDESVWLVCVCVCVCVCVLMLP